ncbi:MAG: hypothetical protein K6G75_02675 [Lachnospiraceae bacterium]|nr:hypothetical protein [Lachnospiraceae bacterium]
MESVFETEQTILPSICDNNAHLSISSIANLFLDIALNHAESLGVGFTGFNERGLFWITSKTKIKILRKADMTDVIKIKTWPEEAGILKCNRDYEITDDKGVIAVGKTEWAIIDSKSHVLQKAKGVYPEGLVISDKISIEEPFAKLKDDFEGELLGSYKIRSVDIDYGKHMNNVAYIRAVEGLFSCEELEKRDFNDFEIHYRNSSFEGETLSFYATENEDHMDIKAVKEDGSTAVLVRLKHTA